MDPQERLERWRNGIKIAHNSHKQAAVRYCRYGRLLGIPVVILSAVVGTTVFTSISSPSEYSTTLQIFAGILSMAATVLSSLHTFLNYGEVSERHREASVKYGNLRREVEQVLCFNESYNQEDLESVMKNLRSKWDGMDLEAPNIPKDIHTSVRNEVMKQYEESKKHP